jgi:hypothetical protein
VKIPGPYCCITSQDVIIMSCCVHGNVIVWKAGQALALPASACM